MFRTKDNKQVAVPADPYALRRDRSTDQSNATDRAALGLEDDLSLNLGRQVTDEARFFTKAGFPGRFREGRVIVQAVDGNYSPEPAIGPGSIARNIRYPQNGIAVGGYFSWAANDLELPPPGPVPEATDPSRVDEYYLSSLFLGLPDSAPWVVAGYDRPQPGLAGFQSPATVMGQPGTGWPVIAPEIPSYGSRVPLRRPRNLVGV